MKVAEFKYDENLNTSKKLKVLIVDDNPHFCNALKFMLLDSFEDKIENVNLVHDGNQCLDELKLNVYDIVFMDINMPNKDGIITTKEATTLYRNIIIIAVSFHSEMKYIVQMIEAGARTYILKEEINKESLEKALSIEYSL